MHVRTGPAYATLKGVAPSHDHQFLALVQQHLEPTLIAAGFVFNQVGVGSPPVSVPLEFGDGQNWLSRRMREARRSERAGETATEILYEAEVEEFAAAFPGSQEVPAGPDCKDLWIWYEPSSGVIDFDLQGEDIDLAGRDSLVNNVSRPLEARVVALARAVESFLADASTRH
jgi:hypothetical protein